jgi:hypothetical protein
LSHSGCIFVVSYCLTHRWFCETRYSYIITIRSETIYSYINTIRSETRYFHIHTIRSKPDVST